MPSILIASGLESKKIEPLAADLVESLIQDKVEDVASTDDVYDGVTDLEPFSQIVVPELIYLQVSSSEWGSYRQQMSVSGFDRHLSQAFEGWIRTELQTDSDIDKNSEIELPACEPDQARRLLEVYA
ncbi:hypothetical protein, partial [Klebsiella variicola]|uniref:hypothetical protein n=1 Tax=Klebsiella variicola TaxID=244366 RepID=UPI0013CF6DE8